MDKATPDIDPSMVLTSVVTGHVLESPAVKLGVEPKKRRRVVAPEAVHPFTGHALDAIKEG